MTSIPPEHLKQTTPQDHATQGAEDRAWDWRAAKAREQDWPKATLYMIATPIGNLRDMTLRALDCIERLDALGAEDTRLTRRLLDAYALRSTVFALHQHNEAEAAEQVVQRLERGERVGYVSDAGTPGISDPGTRLVARVSGAGYRVIPLPGASALTAAVSVAGLPDAPLHFVGFLPSKSMLAQRSLRACPAENANLIFYEAPHRIESTLKLLAEHFDKSRTVTVARELTKQFETIVTAPLEDILEKLLASGPARGEFVVLLHAKRRHEDDEVPDDAAHDRMLAVLLERLPLSEAVATAVQLTGAPRKALYKRALALKPRGEGDAHDPSEA